MKAKLQQMALRVVRLAQAVEDLQLERDSLARELAECRRRRGVGGEREGR